MKGIHLCLLIALTAFSSTSQELPNLIGPNKVTTVAYWKKGDSRKYRILKEDTQFRNEKKKPTLIERSEYTLTVKVLEEQDSSYILEMIYSDFVFPEKEKNSHITQKFERLSEGMKIRYCTDELGVYDSIINGEELNLQLNEALDQALELLEPQATKADQKELLQNLFTYYKELFSDPENLDALYASDIILIHGYYGIEMTIAKPIDFELVYPTLNNFVLGGTGTCTLNDINKTTKTFTFLTAEEPDEEEVKAYLEEIYNLLTMDLARKIPEFSDFSFTTRTKARYTMELRTGWLVKATCTNSMNIQFGKDKVKKVSKTTMDLL